MRALTGLFIFALSLTHATANGPREDAAAGIITGLERSMAFDGGWWREGSDIRTAAGIVATAADVAAITNRADVLAIVAAQDASENVPTTFRTGVAVPIPDADGHYMLLQPQGDGQPVVAIQISDSPIDPATWRARRDAKLAAIEADRVTRAQDYAAKQTKAKQAAQGAQNVPQLRAAMADMQAQIDALRAIVEAGR